jgi:hypothetical protein
LENGSEKNEDCDDKGDSNDEEENSDDKDTRDWEESDGELPITATAANNLGGHVVAVYQGEWF